MRHLVTGLAVIVGMLWLSPASAECMTRPFKDSGDTTREYPVVVPPGEISEYAERGYQPTDCRVVNAAAMQKRVCELAQIKSPGVQYRIEQVLGVSAGKMCASSKLATRAIVPAN